MSTTAAFFPLSVQTILDSNGVPIVGAQITFYDAGTTTLRPVYADAALSSALTSPVRTDGFGRVPPVFIGVGAYKFTLSDADGALLSTVDNLPGGVAIIPPSPSAVTTIPPGFEMCAHRGDQVVGWLIENGQTIGNATSGATGRANADTSALYSVLWNNDPTLPVNGGRGTSALNDFNAGKPLALPDMRGRTPIGRDNMSNGTAAGRITTAIPAGNDALGTSAGVDNFTLALGQMPAHSHAVTVNSGGGFTPTGSIDNQGVHSHTGSTDVAPDHAHQYTLTVVGTNVASSGGTQNSAYTSQNNTGPAGSHNHQITTNLAGGHSHNLTLNAVGPHTHTATESSVGGGGPPLSTLQPVMTKTWYIKL